MPSTDKSSRSYAVPVRGTIWGLNYNERSERDILNIAGVPILYSDLHDYFRGYGDYGGPVVFDPVVGANSTCVIRILKPHYGELAECFLDLQYTVASGDSDLTLKIAVGRLDSGNYNRVTTYTDDEINASWRQIRGSDTPLSVSSGKIAIDLLDLLPALPVYGDADYRRDVFVLVLRFNKTPTVTGTSRFNIFNVHTSVTGVL